MNFFAANLLFVLTLTPFSFGYQATDEKKAPVKTFLGKDVKVKKQVLVAKKLFTLIGNSFKHLEINLLMESVSTDKMLNSLEKDLGLKMTKLMRKKFHDEYEMYNASSLGQKNYLADAFLNAKMVRVDLIDEDSFIVYSRGWVPRTGNYVRFKYWICREPKKSWVGRFTILRTWIRDTEHH